MPRRSAGILVYRPVEDGIEVLAVHPGGPFWAKKDAGAWSIPKGELEQAEGEEEAYEAARREFAEEMGRPAPDGAPLDLGEIRQKGGKVVRAFALELGGGLPDEDGRGGDRRDEEAQAILSVTSNLVELEWPRGTGRRLIFPEVDRAEWMSPDVARVKLVPAQVALVDRLLELLER